MFGSGLEAVIFRNRLCGVFLASMIDSNKRNMVVGTWSRCFAMSPESDFSVARETTPVVFAITGDSEGCRLMIWVEV